VNLLAVILSAVLALLGNLLADRDHRCLGEYHMESGVCIPNGCQWREPRAFLPDEHGKNRPIDPQIDCEPVKVWGVTIPDSFRRITIGSVSNTLFVAWVLWIFLFAIPGRLRQIAEGVQPKKVEPPREPPLAWWRRIIIFCCGVVAWASLLFLVVGMPGYFIYGLFWNWEHQHQAPPARQAPTDPPAHYYRRDLNPSDYDFAG